MQIAQLVTSHRIGVTCLVGYQLVYDYVQNFFVTFENDYILANVVPKSKTIPYQRSFMIRATRIWNHLVDELNLNTDSLSSFKSVMFKYYISSLYSCYDVEDPRSYKTIIMS